MQFFISIFILILSSFSTLAHTEHYEDFKSIEMEIFKDDKSIGSSVYEFQKSNGELAVKNTTDFKVKLLGITVFSISSSGLEIYQNGKLISFKSKTLQNDKKKYVNLKFNEQTNKFDIQGSSYNGIASTNSVVGNWWSHKILQADSQISPVSGSIKEQVVTFIAKEKIELYGKTYDVDHFKLTSKDMSLPKDKRLNFDIWFNKKNSLILKVTYSRLGNWEYKVKKFE